MVHAQAAILLQVLLGFDALADLVPPPCPAHHRAGAREAAAALVDAKVAHRHPRPRRAAARLALLGPGEDTAADAPAGGRKRGVLRRSLPLLLALTPLLLPLDPYLPVPFAAAADLPTAAVLPALVASPFAAGTLVLAYLFQFPAVAPR